MNVLLLGCGSRRNRIVKVEGRTDWTGQMVTTLDHNRDHNPNYVWDLNIFPWPFENNSFDEIHAYEVLEHLGRQGDVRTFFGTFFEIWRILKPGGYLAATCPLWNSIWAWGDPSHTRIISEGSLVFLDRMEYKAQVGKTPMSDFRSVWHGDFIRTWVENRSEQLHFILQAVKPARI